MEVGDRGPDHFSANQWPGTSQSKGQFHRYVWAAFQKTFGKRYLIINWLFFSRQNSFCSATPLSRDSSRGAPESPATHWLCTCGWYDLHVMWPRLCSDQLRASHDKHAKTIYFTAERDEETTAEYGGAYSYTSLTKDGACVESYLYGSRPRQHRYTKETQRKVRYLRTWRAIRVDIICLKIQAWRCIQGVCKKKRTIIWVRERFNTFNPYLILSTLRFFVAHTLRVCP